MHVLLICLGISWRYVMSYSFVDELSFADVYFFILESLLLVMPIMGLIIFFMYLEISKSFQYVMV